MRIWPRERTLRPPRYAARKKQWWAEEDLPQARKTAREQLEVDMTERKKEAEKLKDADKLELEEELELEDVTELRKEAERLDAWKKVGSGEGSGLGSGLGGGSGLELEEELELEDLTELKRKAPIFDEEEEDSLATLSSEQR